MFDLKSLTERFSKDVGPTKDEMAAIEGLIKFGVVDFLTEQAKLQGPDVTQDQRVDLVIKLMGAMLKVCESCWTLGQAKLMHATIEFLVDPDIETRVTGHGTDDTPEAN